MANQKIRFAAPPGLTITIDVFNGEPALAASAAHSNLACTEATNAKGVYEVTSAFSGTLATRCYFVKKSGGSAIGWDYVTMVNADGTYTAEQLKSVRGDVQEVIEVNHLDHLLAVTYDPASKPGVSDALFNELIENDGGVARLTANALEQSPAGGGGGGGDATAANQNAILAEIQKIPRASASLTAGAQHKRTNQNGDFIRETISAP